jgi:hypothetical protein
MGKKSSLNRRDFLKKTAVGTAGLTAGLSLLKPAKAQAATIGAWTGTNFEINPNISNLRVVCMYDTAMITNATPNYDSCDDVVNACDQTAIDTNMDNMAMWLAQKTTATEAWSTIFQKPASKTWPNVIVAIKVNTCNITDEPRVPVIMKICNVLKTLEVTPGNITIYDGACQNISGSGYSNYFNTKGGTYNGYTVFPCNVSADLLTTSVTVPNVGSKDCPSTLANGTTDILINISVNKGHTLSADGNTGGCTLAHKNHFGTFTPTSPMHTMPISTGDCAIYCNMTDAIIGGTPVRQQLCIVDSLWADNNDNPDGQPNGALYRLVMGTFAGAVDLLTCLQIKYLIAYKQLGGVWKNNMDITVTDTNGVYTVTGGQVAHFMTLYGYESNDPDLEWVAITPASVYGTGVLSGAASGGQPHTLEVRLAGGAAMARFELPQSTTGAMEIRMFDLSGRSVRKMFVELQEGRTSVSWDGKNDNGSAVAPGTYEVRVLAQHYMHSGRITVE